MYIVQKRMEVAGSHSLSLPYKSKCANMHGHNWIITVEARSEELNEEGMVIDFTKISEIVNKLDHANLNTLFPFNPTAENIGLWIAAELGVYLEETPDIKTTQAYISRVSVQESEGNTAIWTPDFP